MKKILVALILALMIAMLLVMPGLAQQGKINIKGEVLAVGNGTIEVESNKGKIYTVIVPEGFDISSFQVGDSILIKGIFADDGSVKANFIKQVGVDNDDGVDNGKKPGTDDDKNNNGKKPDNDTGNKPEGSKDNSAFCAEDKQDKPHPFDPKMVERYGVEEGWVTKTFCEGYSMGAIMLALKTSQMDGVNVSPATLLTERAEGTAWGQLWKDWGVIGREKDGQSPPGLLKKPTYAGPKE